MCNRLCTNTIGRENVPQHSGGIHIHTHHVVLPDIISDIHSFTHRARARARRTSSCLDVAQWLDEEPHTATPSSSATPSLRARAQNMESHAMLAERSPPGTVCDVYSVRALSSLIARIHVQLCGSCASTARTPKPRGQRRRKARAHNPVNCKMSPRDRDPDEADDEGLVVVVAIILPCVFAYVFS